MRLPSSLWVLAFGDFLWVVSYGNVVDSGDKDCRCCAPGKVCDVGPGLSVCIWLHEVEHLKIVVCVVEVQYWVTDRVIVAAHLEEREWTFLRIVVPPKFDSYTAR